MWCWDFNVEGGDMSTNAAKLVMEGDLSQVELGALLQTVGALPNAMAVAVTNEDTSALVCVQEGVVTWVQGGDGEVGLSGLVSVLQGSWQRFSVYRMTGALTCTRPVGSLQWLLLRAVDEIVKHRGSVHTRDTRSLRRVA